MRQSVLIELWFGTDTDIKTCILSRETHPRGTWGKKQAESSQPCHPNGKLPAHGIVLVSLPY